WDKRIENLDKEVSHIFVTWLKDGTLEQIINHEVLGNKADKLFVDSEIERLDQKDENLTMQLAQTIPLNNVSQYGFNSDSIIQAISEAENGSVIGFPFGEYIIDKEVTLNKEINLIGFNATLKFEGEGKLIINNNNVNISGFVFDGQNNDLSCLLRINKDLNNITINYNVFKNVSSVTHNTSYFIEVHCVNISNLSIRGNVFKDITNLSTVVGVGD